MRKLEKQVNEYIEYCEKVRGLSFNSIKNKKWTLNDFIEETNKNSLEKLTNKDIEKYIICQKERGCLNSTINTRISQIKAFLRYFEERDIYSNKLNTKTILKLKQTAFKPIYYNDIQINKALQYADDRTALMIKLCYECGFRIAELQSLTLQNIKGRCILFIGKGSKQREVYISEQTKKELDEYVINNHITNHLWLGRSSINFGKPIKDRTIRYNLEKVFTEAGFPEFHPHCLRHSFATNICNNGAPLPVAQKMLGHSRITTTERYVHSFDGHLMQYFDQYRFKKL